MFLNCVDDGTCYQIASRLLERTEDAVLKNLLNGWVCFFGPPDELVLDARCRGCLSRLPLREPCGPDGCLREMRAP